LHCKVGFGDRCKPCGNVCHCGKILPVVMFKRVVGFAIEVYAVVIIAFVLTLAVTMLMMLAVMVMLVMFALVVVAFNNQEEAIEIPVEAVILEAFQSPLKISIDKANELIEIDTSGMVDRAIKAITMTVQMSVCELKLMA